MIRALMLGALLASGCAGGRAAVAGEGRRDVSELVVLEADAIVVREAIQFPHGKADIEPTSMDLLDAVAVILERNPSIRALSIEGHTDTTGEPELNQPLSEARALAVKRYLEGKGVAAARLQSKGFGASQPLDTNDTEAGRARNRRVEFKVLR